MKDADYGAARQEKKGKAKESSRFDKNEYSTGSCDREGGGEGVHINE